VAIPRNYPRIELRPVVKSTKTSAGAAPRITRSLFEGLSARLDRVTPAITARIRAEVPGYEVLAMDRHALDVDRQIRNIVNGLVTGSVPSAAAIDHARGVGRQRAADGMALPDVIEAYHIAYREIWAEVLAEAQRADPPLTDALVSEVGLLWLWFHRLSAAVAESHAAETQTRHSNRLTFEREFLDQLTERAPQNDSVAADLGYQAGDEFSVACVAGLGARAEAERIGELLRGASQAAVCVYQESHAVVVAQHITAEQICAAVAAVRPTARIGFGIPRAGLSGARMSLLDAQAAVGRTTRAEPVVDFRRDWLMSSLNAIRPRFEDLLQPTLVMARKYPQLVQTVQAYVECRYSVSACARRLHIHPNSARYRLDRWMALTGWDVQTFNGMTASVIAFELLGAARPADASAEDG
jgi:hypothetical protein